MSVFYEFDDVDAFTTGTVGVPGNRTFFMQVRSEGQRVTVKCEKQQTAAIVQYLRKVLSDLPPPEDRPMPGALELAEVIDDGRCLLLLALDADPLAVGPDLHVERPVARLADGARRERVDVVELIEDTHQAGLSSLRGRPVELTASTMGPPACHVTALIEAGLMTMRWNKSICVPIA